MSSRKLTSNSSSREDDQENHCAVTETINDKKRRRMQSNRQSAKRSRMKKEQHVKDLNDQITYMRGKTTDMVKKINKIEQCYAAVQSENKILRIQGEELRKRLDSLVRLVSFDTLAASNNDKIMINMVRTFCKVLCLNHGCCSFRLLMEFTSFN